MSNQNKPAHRKYRVDILVISAFLVLSLAILAIRTLTRVEGAVAVVEINKVAVAEYPLSVNGTFPLNGGTNVLVIEDGKAYLNYSDCPDHTCEKTGKIHYVGQSISCKPNALSVIIQGESQDGVDLVS